MVDKIEELIERRHIYWRRYYDTLSIRKSTKFVNGRDTGVSCITFYVLKKSKYRVEDVGKIPRHLEVPKEIDGTPTDVVELSTVDYEIGQTEVSKKSPDTQKRIASGVKRQ